MLCIALLVWVMASGAAVAAAIDTLRYQLTADQARIILESRDPFPYRVGVGKIPKRLVVILPGGQLPANLPQPANHRVLGPLGDTQVSSQGVRLSFALKRTVAPRVSTVAATAQHGHQLIIELSAEARAAGAATAKPRAVDGTSAARRKGLSDATPRARSVLPAAHVPQRERFVVMIDAGHGGKDVGAIAADGLQEKDVVLALARQLRRLINREPGMRALLTRNGDEFLPLRQRMQSAREARAGLFVSIHADAFTDERVAGASVFVLSEQGATNEATRLLAERENAVDRIAGVNLNDKDDRLREVLLDLSQTATSDASYEAARAVLKRLSEVGTVHFGTVQRAEFLVLKSPDVPSILVETAFISNPEEAARLRDTAQQQRLAEALFTGIRDYAMQHVRTSARVASR